MGRNVNIFSVVPNVVGNINSLVVPSVISRFLYIYSIKN